MNQDFSDLTSPAPNERSQSNAQPPTRPSEYAAPLHERVPPEIFVAIIHLCVGSATPVRDLVTLQLVCRSWHDIIADASFLWGTINAAEGLPAVRKALQMAKNSSIDLTCINTNDHDGFLELARGKIDQWRSFVVESWYWESALADLRSKRPPNLDTLHVKATYAADGEDEEIVLFGGAPAPGLKDVWFANVPINRASLQLSGLKSLRLEGMPSVSANEVIALITGSPGLEILHLVFLENAFPPAEASPSQPNLASNSPIELASLIELKLFYLGLPFLSYLLSTLTFPQLHSLHVGCELDTNTAFQLGQTVGMNRLDSNMKLVASGARTYDVTLFWGSYVVSIGGLNVFISCLSNTYMDHFLKTFTWLSDHLEQSLHELPLHLILRRRDSASLFLDWFTGHTNVATLTLDRDEHAGGKEIIQILAQPRSPPPSPPDWLFPQLEVLHANFVDMDGDAAILIMIERRHAASRQSSAAGANPAFPKRFREIRLVHDYTGPPPNAEFMSKVVQAAEGADVYWEGKKWVGS